VFILWMSCGHHYETRQCQPRQQDVSKRKCSHLRNVRLRNSQQTKRDSTSTRQWEWQQVSQQDLLPLPEEEEEACDEGRVLL